MYVHFWIWELRLFCSETVYSTKYSTHNMCINHIFCIFETKSCLLQTKTVPLHNEMRGTGKRKIYRFLTRETSIYIQGNGIEQSLSRNDRVQKISLKSCRIQRMNNMAEINHVRHRANVVSGSGLTFHKCGHWTVWHEEIYPKKPWIMEFDFSILFF